MASLSTFLRYVSTKFEYSVSLYEKTHGRVDPRSFDAVMRTFLTGKLTFLHRYEEKALPTRVKAGTFLVRGIPNADTKNTFVGDMVVLKDPMNSEKYLVRRIAAVEGHEMICTDGKEESFVLGKNECWVLADGEAGKVKGSYDSRSFGPVEMKEIVGRAIYLLVNDAEHGAVNNSNVSMRNDKPVLAIELDLDVMKSREE